MVVVVRLRRAFRRRVGLLVVGYWSRVRGLALAWVCGAPFSFPVPVSPWLLLVLRRRLTVCFLRRRVLLWVLARRSSGWLLSGWMASPARRSWPLLPRGCSRLMRA